MLALLLAAGTAAAATRGANAVPMAAISPQSLKYINVPNMPDCFTAAILRGDPRTGPAWVLLKLTSGCRVPAHWHTANEDLVVISGRGTVFMQGGAPLQFAPGAYASLPAHHVHHMSCTRACLVFSSADGAFDIHYVDARGKEISLEKAMEPPPKRRKRR